MAKEESSPWLVPVLVLIGTVTAVISSLGAPLLPTIARNDHVSLGDAQWSLTITMLVGSVVAPVMGRLGDGPARRGVILTALGVVVLGSVLAAVPSNDFTLLLVGRGLHGLGLGLMPLTMAVARDHLPPHKSSPAIALLSIAAVAGTGLGYPVTGVLDDSLGLHATFLFGAVVAGGALIAALPVVPRSGHVHRRPLDLPGAVLLGAALVAILLGVTEAGAWGWGSLRIMLLLAGGVVLACTWIRRELTTAHPLVDIRLLRHPSVMVSNASAFLIAMSLYMFLPLLTDYVQTPPSKGYGFGVSVVVTGLMIIPFSVLSTSMSRVAAAFGARFGEGTVVPVGSIVLVAAIGMFALTGGAIWEAYAVMGLFGLGVGFTFAAMPGLIVRAVPQQETGSALGFYQVVRYVGFAIGSAIAASILSGNTAAGAVIPSRAGFTAGFTVAAGICLVAAVVSASIGRSAPLRSPAATAELASISSAEEIGAEVVFE